MAYPCPMARTFEFKWFWMTLPFLTRPFIVAVSAIISLVFLYLVCRRKDETDGTLAGGVSHHNGWRANPGKLLANDALSPSPQWSVSLFPGLFTFIYTSIISTSLSSGRTSEIFLTMLTASFSHCSYKKDWDPNQTMPFLPPPQQ